MVKGARIVDDTIWLIPANPRYKPWPCKESDRLEVIGVVIEVIRKPDNTCIRRAKLSIIGEV
jgi:SOS-response transcriptional repressor LexA